MRDETKILIDKLKNDLEYHRRRYYELDDPIISDQEYDALYDQYLNYQKQYPELADSVGWKPFGAEYNHHHRMLSLRSTKDMIAVSAVFIRHNCKVSCEPKLDGLAIELVYRNSILTAAATRGDGVVGEDITKNIMSVGNLPKRIDTSADVEIYGEIFLTKEAFFRLNKIRISNNQSPYSNPRNAAAGIIRSLDNSSFIEYLNFFPYTVFGTNLETQHQCHVWLANNGFETLSDIISILDSDDIFDYYEHMRKIRNDLPFEIDGLVFKVDNLDLHSIIGEGSTHPNWAIALKFEPEQACTRITDVVFQVGKSGVIAPVAILDKVCIRGSNIKRASLATAVKIKEKDIRIGDFVMVSLANDVIPYIVSSVVEDRTGKEQLIKFPDHCPVCNTAVSQLGPHTICTNQNCPAQILGKLSAAVGRNGFNIKGLGLVIIQKLIDNKLISDLSDIFDLINPDKIRIMKQLGFGDKIVDNLCDEIQRAKNVPLVKFIFALGIPGVNVATANKLAEYYGAIDNLIGDVTINGVVKLPKTDSHTLACINRYFNNSKNTQLINRMRTNQVAILDHEFKYATTDKFTVTGVLSMPRTEVVEIALLRGYKYSSLISRLTKFVVVGKSPSDSKISKASLLGIPILSEKEFMEKMV